MTLAFTDSTDPIKVTELVVTIVSPPGIGKTSLAATIPGAIVLDFDRGIARTQYRAPSLALQTWADALAVHEHARVLGASAVVVDTIGRAADLCGTAIVAEGGKGLVYQGALTLQGYGQLKARMLPWLARFRGKDLILLSHQREEKKGDNLIVRPDILGATLQEVLRSSDLVGYLSMVGKARTLDFDPQEDRLGKNSAGLPVYTVPDWSKGNRTFLADILADAKRAMTSQTEESAKAEGAILDWRARIEECTTADDLTALLPLVLAIAETPIQAQAKSLLNARAKGLGLTYSKEGKNFFPKVA